MVTRIEPQQAGQVFIPAASIAALGVLLVAGLSVLGIQDRCDQWLAQLVAQGRVAAFPKSLPVWAIWLATVGFAFGTSVAILEVAGTWRRLILWFTTLILVAAWAPVLGLAAHVPAVSAPFIAVLWSGICALLYASQHRMAVDEKPAPYEDETR
jgi:hypothetical protein